MIFKGERYAYPNDLKTYLKTGWYEVRDETWAYASASTFTVATDATTRFQKGQKVRWKDGGSYKYGYIIGVTATVITVVGATVSNATITDVAISTSANPLGFTGRLTFTPTLTGTSSLVVSSITPQIGEYTIDGEFCELTTIVGGTLSGTAAPAIHSNLPVASISGLNEPFYGWYSLSSGSIQNIVRAFIISSSEIRFNRENGANFTTSGTCTFGITGRYRI